MMAQNLLRDKDTRTSQQKGRYSTMPSLRPVTEEGGEAKINITPQLVKEIFEEYPRVKTAFEENVPDKVYYAHKFFNFLQSKIFN
jgi:transcription initiation factor TFIIH subunit 1